MPLRFGNSKEREKEKPSDDEEKPRRKRPKFLRGSAAKKEFDRATKKAKERAERAGSIFRFFIKDSGERRITFLDGKLNDDGILDIPYRYEHTVPFEGSFETFECTQKQEPCPICEQGDDPSYVGVMTIIEHGDFEDRISGDKHDYRRRLYVAKLQTLKKLQHKASKYDDDLTGITFDVMRTGKRDARVGSDFDFVSKDPISSIAKELEKPEHAKPADYENEPGLMYRTADELEELGFGTSSGVVGGSKRRAKNDDLDKDLG
jgi:hypothetical protein